MDQKKINIVCQNKKAHFNYFIEKKFEAGMVLYGSEVKSLRAGGAQLADAFVDLKKGKPVLYNAYIAPYEHTSHDGHQPTRPRELLLHRRETEKLFRELKPKGMSLIPLKIYFKGPYAKIELGLAKGKKNYDKREDLKRKDHEREIGRVKKFQ